MTKSEKEPIYWTDERTGSAVFLGEIGHTGVPIRVLFEYLIHGKTVEDFLSTYKNVNRDNVNKVITLVIDHFLYCPSSKSIGIK